MKCRDIMSRDVLFCTSDDTCMTAAQKLCENDVGSVPVVESPHDRKLVGMLTDRDICCRVAAKGRDAASVPVREAMTSQVVSCKEGDFIEQAERLMKEHQIRRIPVVDDQGECVGII